MVKKIILLVIFCITTSNNSQDNGQLVEQKKSVSYIYFPRTHFLLGHSEIEINGCSYTIIDSNYYAKELTDLIKKAKKDGLPFFRFVFKTDKQQEAGVMKTMDMIKEKKEIFAFNCADGASIPLKKGNLCSIPLPFKFSPLLSAIYLTISKKCGLNNVERIEYYSDKSLSNNIKIIAQGMATEAACPLLFLAATTSIVWVHTVNSSNSLKSKL